MIVETKSLVEVSQEAIRLLYRELGVVDTVRFLSQFTVGYGNYTEEREYLFADLTLDQTIAAINATKAAPRAE